jgi:hypothetical protein
MPHLEPLKKGAKQDAVKSRRAPQPPKRKLSLPKRDPRSSRRG